MPAKAVEKSLRRSSRGGDSLRGVAALVGQRIEPNRALGAVAALGLDDLLRPSPFGAAEGRRLADGPGKEPLLHVPGGGAPTLRRSPAAWPLRATPIRGLIRGISRVSGVFLREKWGLPEGAKDSEIS